MKRILKLTENQFSKLIKKIVLESTLIVDPFELTAINNNVKIKNSTTGKSYTYSMKVYQEVDLGLGKVGSWIGVSVLDFPNGTHIKVKAPIKGIVQKKVDKESLKNLLSKNFGTSVLKQKLEDGSEIKFEKN